MSIYIGIDGGGTTTRILIESAGGPPQYFECNVSIKARHGNFEPSAIALLFLLHSKLGDDLSDVHAIAIGLSGMSRTEDQEALKQAIHGIPELSQVKLHVETDATLTLAAVIPEGEPGILLIAGTGSVIFYQPRGGTPRRIGGWGPTLSDEGSGYRLGLRVLRRYVHVLDGIVPHDALSEAIANRLPPEAREDRFALSRLVEQEPSLVASLARDVLDAAMDPLSDIDVLREEFIELILMVLPICSFEIMNSPRPYNLYLSGSVAKHPMTIEVLKRGFDESDVYFIPVDDHVPCMKALEIAKGIV